MLLLCLTLALYNPGLALALPMAYSIDSKHGGTVSCDDDIHGWHLLWNDEFDGTQLDTSSTWAYELYDSWQYGFGQWGNDEKQFYTQENVRVEDGVLRILAMYEPNSTRLLDLCWQECFERCIKAGKVEGTADFQGCMDGCGNTGGRCANVQSTGISSGRIYVKYRGFQPSFRHPVIRIEAKIRMSHAGLGLWPAFWLLPWHDQVGSVGPGEGRYGRWPASGEIDIFESANDMSFAHGSLHDGRQVVTHATRLHPPATSYHVYGIEWHRIGMMRWYVDGKYYYGTNTTDRWWTNARGAPFDQPFYPIFNLAVGGNYPDMMQEDGQQGSSISIEQLQAMLQSHHHPKGVTMDINYIRVCYCSTTTTTTTVEEQHMEMRDTHAIHGSMGDSDHHHHQYSYHNVGRRPDNQCISFPQLWSVMQD